MNKIKNAVLVEDFNSIEFFPKDADNIFKPGTKFRIPGDKDPWYVVGLTGEKVKGEWNLLVVYKSWAKYKNRWVYKVDEIFSLLFSLYLKQELYARPDGSYVIVDNKN